MARGGGASSAAKSTPTGHDEAGPQEEWIRLFEENATVYQLGQVPRRFFERLIQSPYVSKIRSLSPQVPGKVRVMEAGCGSGKLSVAFAAAGCQVTAMDYSMQMLKNARGLLAVAKEYYGELEVSLVQQDLNQLGFADESFDVVFNEGVIEHWLDREARLHVLREMARVTKKGGLVAAFVPNGRHPLHRWWEWTRYPGYLGSPPMVRYDAAVLASDLREAGLGVVETDGVQPFRTICQWPAFRLLEKMANALDRFVPLPRWARKKWGINLVAIARK